MDGATQRIGAVAGILGPRNPIQAARLVMDHSPHVLLAGSGALAFLRAQDARFEDPAYFGTPERREALDLFLANSNPRDVDDADRHGTVGAVALDRQGNLAAATSTGGMTGKLPGRLGDTPVPGAGTWADPVLRLLRHRPRRKLHPRRRRPRTRRPSAPPAAGSADRRRRNPRRRRRNRRHRRLHRHRPARQRRAALQHPRHVSRHRHRRRTPANRDPRRGPLAVTRLALLALILALPACDLGFHSRAQLRWIGQVTPTTTGPTCAASTGVLLLRENQVIFTPDEGTWVLSGTAHATALSQPPTAAEPRTTRAPTKPT